MVRVGDLRHPPLWKPTVPLGKRQSGLNRSWRPSGPANGSAQVSQGPGRPRQLVSNESSWENEMATQPFRACCGGSAYSRRGFSDCVPGSPRAGQGCALGGCAYVFGDSDRPGRKHMDAGGGSTSFQQSQHVAAACRGKSRCYHGEASQRSRRKHRPYRPRRYSYQR